MKKLIIIFTLLASLATQASSRSEAGRFHLFAAAGALGGLGSIRVGGPNLEIGILAPGAFGANYLVQFSPSLYMPLGVVITPEPGVYAGAGVEFLDIRYFSMRFEAGATSTINNMTAGSLLLGINLIY